jgi:hypothetical protein
MPLSLEADFQGCGVAGGLAGFPRSSSASPRLSVLYRILFRNHARQSAITEFLCLIDKLLAVPLLPSLFVICSKAMTRMCLL